MGSLHACSVRCSIFVVLKSLAKLRYSFIVIFLILIKTEWVVPVRNIV